MAKVTQTKNVVKVKFTWNSPFAKTVTCPKCGNSFKK